MVCLLKDVKVQLKVKRTLSSVGTSSSNNRVVNDKPFVDKRKPLSMTAVKGNLHNGEHMLIPVMVKMIHSAIRDCERFVLKDG